jgi:hypothetical protein
MSLTIVLDEGLPSTPHVRSGSFWESDSTDLDYVFASDRNF